MAPAQRRARRLFAAADPEPRQDLRDVVLGAVERGPKACGDLLVGQALDEVEHFAGREVVWMSGRALPRECITAVGRGRRTS